MNVPFTAFVLTVSAIASFVAPPTDDELPWGKPGDGLACRLTLVTKHPALGSPINLKLEVKNVGDKAASYDDQQAATNGSLSVTGTDSKPVPYIAASYQTMGHRKSLKPGEVVTIFKELSLADQYLIDRAGQYNVQTRSRGGLPESNKLVIVVGRGKLTDYQELFGHLHRAAPKGWRAANFGGSIVFSNVPTGLKADATSISLMFTKTNADPVKRQASQPATVALGESRLGFGWLSAQNQTAVDRWPDYAKVIGEAIKALDPVQP